MLFAGSGEAEKVLGVDSDRQQYGWGVDFCQGDCSMHPHLGSSIPQCAGDLLFCRFQCHSGLLSWSQHTFHAQAQLGGPCQHCRDAQLRWWTCGSSPWDPQKVALCKPSDVLDHGDDTP